MNFLLGLDSNAPRHAQQGKFCNASAPSTMILPGTMLVQSLSSTKVFFDKVRKRVEIVLTDAAANELLASNVTRGARDPNIEGPGAQILLPCLKLVARDHAHAFRRVIQRPFKATDHLSALMAEHVLGANSPVRIIDGSFIFRQWFDDEVAKLVNGNVHCHNLKSASWMHFLVRY